MEEKGREKKEGGERGIKRVRSKSNRRKEVVIRAGKWRINE